MNHIVTNTHAPMTYNMFITEYDVSTDFINSVTSLNVKSLCK